MNFPGLIGYKDTTFVDTHYDGVIKNGQLIRKERTYVVTCRTYLYKNLKDLFETIVDNSFEVHISDYKYFNKYFKGDVVILVGNSTAGKTSIIKALLQRESNRIEDGSDLRSINIDLMSLKIFCPHELEVLKRVMKNDVAIPNAVFTKERLLKSDVSSQEKLEAEEAIKRIKTKYNSFSPEEKSIIEAPFRNLEFKMLDDAFENSRRGRNVVLDVLDLDNLSSHLLRREFKGPIRIILTFCPFSVLTSRIEKRNREAIQNGELSNQRIGSFPLRQFSNVFGRNENGKKAFETLSRKEVTKVYLEHFDKGIEAASNDGLKDSPEEILLNRQSKLQNFLNNLGFKEGEEIVDIAPNKREVYNLFLNTAILSPELSAAIISASTYIR
jgi:hypothetical protein